MNEISNGVESVGITIPAFKGVGALRLEVSALKEAERRLIEAKLVNPSTYAELEHCYGSAYRELKKNIADLGFQIGKTEKEIDRIKADLLFDHYPEFIKDKPKYDNATTRNLFLCKNPEVQEGEDRLLFLKRLENDLDGRLKVMENVSRVIKKQIDIILRQSGPYNR